MTASYPTQDDQPLVHQFIRRFGRRPTADELDRFQESQAAVGSAVRAKVRHRLARLIMRA